LKYYLICAVFLLSITVLNFGQRYHSNSPHISFFAGDLSIQSQKFAEFYETKNDLVYGIGFGIPVSNSITIDASASYFQKSSNYSVEPDSEFLNSAIIKQIIFNTGFQVNLMPNRIIGLSFLGGLNYAMIDEEKKDHDGNFLSEVEDWGNLGIYLGADFELCLGKGPISIFGDAKYTYSWNPILEYEETYRDLKYTAGLKLYLKRRWR
jgi:hypothetical protein